MLRKKKVIIALLLVFLVASMSTSTVLADIYIGDDNDDPNWEDAFYDAYQRSSYYERNVVVQRVLEQLGYGTTVDGYFGSNTKADVESLQAASGGWCDVDGWVGNDTWFYIQTFKTEYGGQAGNLDDYYYKVDGKTIWYFRHLRFPSGGYFWQVLHSNGQWYTVY